MKHHPEGWYVGQEVCVVVTLNVRGEPVPRMATVSKIGRKWIYLDSRNGRFDAETWRLDGGGYSSPGDVYLSLDDYQNSTVKAKEWQDFKNSIPWDCPKHITRDDVAALMRAIKETPNDK